MPPREPMSHEDIIYCTKCGRKLITEKIINKWRKRFHPQRGQKQIRFDIIRSCPKMRSLGDGHAFYLEDRGWMDD